MKNSKRRGFTIVELVIVIAIIAILAAILIPTFSNITKKANLNADKQAVRSMNEALAQYEASYGYGKVTTIEDAMQVLANAGYNADNWVCLTAGYQVYWYETDNRCILYNSSTSEIEYPEEYVGYTVTINGVKTPLMLTTLVHIYNENHVKAQQFNMSLSSSTATIKENGASISSVTESKTILNGVALESTKNSANNLSALSSASSTIKAALGGNDSSVLKLYATKEVVSSSSNTYASLQISSMAVGANETAVEPVLRSDGNYEENVYYLSVVGEKGTDDYKAATKAASQYIYNIFDQITEGKINDDVTVIIAPGTELDCSSFEWAPCKTFTGYFGTTDKDNPVIINGATLSSKTGFAQTVGFQGTPQIDGTETMYYVTGFFGVVYGSTTIENVTFKNLTINEPALDAYKTLGEKAARRNTVAIIGGITDGSYEDGEHEANVIIRNVNVDNSCNITGIGCAAGLVGYIGGASNNRPLTGSVVIYNCNVAANVKSEWTGSSSYGVTGGIVSFITRNTQGFSGCNKEKYKGTSESNITDLNTAGNNYFTDITIANCTFTGTLSVAEGHIANNIIGQVHQKGVRVFGDNINVSYSTNTGVDIYSSAGNGSIVTYASSAWATSDHNPEKE